MVETQMWNRGFRGEAAKIRGNDWAGDISKYEVTRWEAKVEYDWRMVMRISKEGMEVRAREICFPR